MEVERKYIWLYTDMICARGRYTVHEFLRLNMHAGSEQQEIQE